MWKDISNSKQSESQFYPSAESLAASHQACRQMGVRKDQRRIAEYVDGSNARPRPFSDHAYIDKANGLLADVHAMLPDRGSVLILTDNSSRVLVLCAIPEVIDRCKGIGLQVGSLLTKTSAGTNAVDLALHRQAPIIMRGSRHHYCRLFAGWYCVATPIVDRSGQTVGCVDLSTSRRTALGEKLPLVATLAQRLSDLLAAPPGLYAPTRQRPDGVVSPRQRAILDLLASGRVAKEIAANLGVSQRTVESHLEKLRKRFNAKTTVELIAKLGQHTDIAPNERPETGWRP